MAEAFVYCWTDHQDKKLYVGYHKGALDDGYICSSTYVTDIYNSRPHTFSRMIVAEGNTPDMRKFEEAILQSADAAKSDDYYNRHNGNGEWFRPKGIPHSEKTKAKMSKSATGVKRKRTAEHNEKIRQSNVGLKRTQETRDRISKSRKGQTSSRKGVKLTDATKHRASESHKRNWEDPNFRTQRIKGIIQSFVNNLDDDKYQEYMEYAQVILSGQYYKRPKFVVGIYSVKKDKIEEHFGSTEQFFEVINRG